MTKRASPALSKRSTCVILNLPVPREKSNKKKNVAILIVHFFIQAKNSQSVIISTQIQYNIQHRISLSRYFVFFSFCTKETQWVFYIYSWSQFRPARFQALISHMGLEVAEVNGGALGGHTMACEPNPSLPCFCITA